MIASNTATDEVNDSIVMHVHLIPIGEMGKQFQVKELWLKFQRSIQRMMTLKDACGYLNFCTLNFHYLFNVAFVYVYIYMYIGVTSCFNFITY